MKNKISILDIAEELGISPTTVSFVINGHAREKRISEHVVKQVSDFIDKTGYRPNSLARSFRTGRTNIIGLMVEDMSNPFFSTIARLIEEKSYQNGYKIIYSSTENKTGRTRDLLHLYADWHVDGYIIVPPEGIEEDIDFLVKTGKPVVQIDRYLSKTKTDVVITNNFESAYDGAKHLIEVGFQNIAFVTVASQQHQLQDRASGYRKALADAGRKPRLLKLLSNGISAENQIISFLKKHDEVDAIFFATNYLCISGLKSLKKLELRIPTDVGVISFDDHEVFDLYSPSITSIAQPIEKIAESTINLLLARLKSENAFREIKRVIIPASLMVRQSTLR